MSALYRAGARLPTFGDVGSDVSEAICRAGCVAFLYRPSADRLGMLEIARAAWHETLAGEPNAFLSSALSDLKELFLEAPFAGWPATTLEDSFVKGVRATARVVGEERARREIGSALQAWALETLTEDPLAAWSGNSLPECHEVLGSWSPMF